MTLEVGQEAPDFELRNHENQTVKLRDLRGKHNVVLAFFPFAFTGICQGEMCSLRDTLHEFETADAVVFGISCDSPHVLRKWSEEQRFNFSLLSDHWPHGNVARQYGVFNQVVGAAERATFVIDKEGTIAETFRSPDLRTPRAKEEYEAALAKLG
jgi:peroxiredoxin (alkyl hydroperoxide reductase subunit C)